MYTAFLERTQQSIEALKQHLATSEAMRSAIQNNSLSCGGGPPCFNLPSLLSASAPDRLEWRKIDHCAAVTRIYAIYEQFAHEMIREHLALAQSHLAFPDLPNELIKSYRNGIATILEKKDGPRYGHLSLLDLIEQYHLGLSNEEYTLEPLALLNHEQNLRLPELARLFAACGMPSIDTWIKKYRSLQEFFDTAERLSGSAEHEMLELIKYRNEAAHGSINVDDILGLDYLYEFCDFVAVICEAISEFVQLKGLDLLIAGGAADFRGKVDECIKADRVLIGTMTGNFRIGDTIYLCGETYSVPREILNLQLEDADRSHVALSEPTEIGLEIDKWGRKKATVVMIHPPSTEAGQAATSTTPYAKEPVTE